MKAVGIIFANTYETDLDELTQKRTMAAVPFGGRYRLIDFALSNMVNAGIKNVGIITKSNYQSLMGHVRSGMEWDLDRKQSGLTFLPPFGSAGGSDVYVNRLESLEANLSFLRRVKEPYVVLCDCGYVGNLDFKDFMDFHEKTDAVMTGFYTEHPRNNVKGVTGTVASVDENGRMTELRITKEKPDDMKLLTNSWIVRREYLMELIKESIKDHKVSLRREVIAPMLKTSKVMAYKSEDPVLFLDDLSEYLKCNLDLLDKNVRDNIFKSDNGPILTKTKDSPPTRYGAEAKAENSLIADGCVIEGEVRDSVIFRGVRVKKGAKIENSVIMQDSTIGEYAKLNYAVLDKNVIIMDGRVLSGYITHPFFCARHSVI